MKKSINWWSKVVNFFGCQSNPVMTCLNFGVLLDIQVPFWDLTILSPGQHDFVCIEHLKPDVHVLSQAWSSPSNRIAAACHSTNLPLEQHQGVHKRCGTWNHVWLGSSKLNYPKIQKTDFLTHHTMGVTFATQAVHSCLRYLDRSKFRAIFIHI